MTLTIDAQTVTLSADDINDLATDLAVLSTSIDNLLKVKERGELTTDQLQAVLSQLSNLQAVYSF